MPAKAMRTSQSKTYETVTTHEVLPFLRTFPPARSRLSIVLWASDAGAGENVRACMRGRTESSGIGKPRRDEKGKRREKEGERVLERGR